MPRTSLTRSLTRSLLLLFVALLGAGLVLTTATPAAAAPTTSTKKATPTPVKKPTVRPAARKTATPVKKATTKKATPTPVKKATAKKATPTPVKKATTAKKATPTPVKKATTKKATPTPVKKATTKKATPTPARSGTSRGGTRPAVAAKAAPAKVAPAVIPKAGVAARVGTGHFVWPAAGRLTQKFTGRHNGIDIAAPTGTPLHATDSGEVIWSGWRTDGLGYAVIIDHHNGYVSIYGHQPRQPPVKVGQYVARGQVIGYIGSTGRSTGPHVHFVIRTPDRRYLNPLKLLGR